jgi:hypothetical protein
VLVLHVVAGFCYFHQLSRKEDLDLLTCTLPDPCLAKQCNINYTAQPARFPILAIRTVGFGSCFFVKLACLFSRVLAKVVAQGLTSALKNR